jgi:hypothetical protein
VTPGPALYLVWSLRYIVSGGFALLLALAPERAVRTIGWAVGAFRPATGTETSGATTTAVGAIASPSPSALGTGAGSVGPDGGFGTPVASLEH